jgi:two-component sensor histidine kinase
MTSTVLKNKKGIVDGYVIALSDISEQIENYNLIRTELNGKTILLKEIHHRVKNNLQLINSILTLQMYYGQDDKLTTLLTGLQARIRTIALIHEKLYQTDNPSELNVCYFLKDLKSILIQVYDLNTDLITFNCDIEEIVLETDIVLQLGLITNELITNSIKYAFPNGKGEILISFKNLGNKYELLIKDDGVGISGDPNLKKPETMGSQLLETLIEQINGTSKINTRNGTEYIISFPHN